MRSKRKHPLQIIAICTVLIAAFLLGIIFVSSFYSLISMNSSTQDGITLTAPEARKDIQKMFNGVALKTSSNRGYNESRWPGEYVKYYRFYTPAVDIDKVLTKNNFKKTKYKSTLKFLKMNKQPDWWKPSELPQAQVYSDGKHWLIYDKNLELAYLYSSSGELGIHEQ